MIRFGLPEYARPIIETLGFISDKDFKSLKQAIENTKPSLNPRTLAKSISAQFKNNDLNLEQIIRMLLTMDSARISAGVRIDNFIDDIIASLRLKTSDKKINLDTLKNRLKILFDIKTIAVSARASDIQREHSNIFSNVRICSDVRPVFNEQGTEALGAVLVHSLRIGYSQDGIMKDAFFALDSDDLKAILKTLERAESKTNSIKSFTKKTGLTLFE